MIQKNELFDSTKKPSKTEPLYSWTEILTRMTIQEIELRRKKLDPKAFRNKGDKTEK